MSKAGHLSPEVRAGRDMEAGLRQELSLRMQECALLRDQLGTLAASATARQAKAANLDVAGRMLRQAVGEQDAAIRALYGSTSWRVAAPLRALSNGLRRLRGRPVAKGLPVPVRLPATRVVPGRVGAAPAEARDRGTVLVAADGLPWFEPCSGGSRLATLMRLMGEAGWSVVFASLPETDHPPAGHPPAGHPPAGHPPAGHPPAGQRGRDEATLHGSGITRVLHGRGETEAFLSATGSRLHHAVLASVGVATWVTPLVRRHCAGASVIYDMAGVHALHAAGIVCARAADMTLAGTDAARAALLDIASELVVETLPNAFDGPQRTPPGVAGRTDVLFTGDFRHGPDGDAVAWFVERIWPLVREAVPGLRLRIAGADPDNDVLALGVHPGVDVLGFVPELGPLYDRHRVFVAPLRQGAGLAGKVGRSMVAGLPVVTNAAGAEGIGLEDGVHGLLAEEEPVFAAQVVRLVTNDALWQLLATQGRSHIERTLSTGVVRARLEAILGG